MHLTDRDDSNRDPGLLGVYAVNPDSQELAIGWAAALGVPVLDILPAQPPGVVLLAQHSAALQLINTADKPGPVNIDFTTAQTRRRLDGTSVRRDPLARAAGLHRRREVTIIDATAGLGRDGLVLAWLGAQVTWIELSPTLALLLHRAIEQARHCDTPQLAAVAQRLKVFHGDGASLLESLEPVDIVYLDPMYPPASMRGAAGKEAQTLRALNGGADHGEERLLLEQALMRSRRRVVVKRPNRAAPLANRQPTRSVRGKSIRFDIY